MWEETIARVLHGKHWAFKIRTQIIKEITNKAQVFSVSMEIQHDLWFLGLFQRLSHFWLHMMCSIFVRHKPLHTFTNLFFLVSISILKWLSVLGCFDVNTRYVIRIKFSFVYVGRTRQAAERTGHWVNLALLCRVCIWFLGEIRYQEKVSELLVVPRGRLWCWVD